MRVVALGDNCLDVYLNQDCLTVGGNAVNVAGNCLAAGHDATYVGPVGTDLAGDAILNGLRENGFETQLVQTVSGISGVTLIRLVNRDREFLFEEFGVCGQWVPEVPGELVTSGEIDWVHVGGPRTMDADYQSISSVSRFVSIDLSTWSPSNGLDLHGVDVAFASADVDRGEATATIGRNLLSLGATEAVVMSGAQGSTWVGTGGVRFFAAHPAERVDTCGAGDSYISGFMMARVSGASAESAMEAGTLSATRTIQHIGGIPQIPRPVPEWVFSDYRRFIEAD